MLGDPRGRVRRRSNAFVIRCFFFNDTATTEIYTLSLHDALPIYWAARIPIALCTVLLCWVTARFGDRKSTRLNSSHRCISYAVFCLKKDIYQPAVNHINHSAGLRNDDRRTLAYTTGLPVNAATAINRSHIFFEDKGGIGLYIFSHPQAHSN